MNRIRIYKSSKIKKCLKDAYKFQKKNRKDICVVYTDIYEAEKLFECLLDDRIVEIDDYKFKTIYGSIFLVNENYHIIGLNFQKAFVVGEYSSEFIKKINMRCRL